jgi:hypothetical protein
MLPAVASSAVVAFRTIVVALKLLFDDGYAALVIPT